MRRSARFRGIANSSLGWSGFFALCIMGATCAIAPMMCWNRSSPPEIIQSQRALFQMMGHDNLSEAGFYDVYPDATPSDFVDFIHSEEGDVLWPATTDHVWEDDTPTRVVDPSTDQLMRPEGVEFVAHEVDPDRGMQLVYIPNDEDGEFIVECYIEPDERPVRVLTWEFPTAAREFDLD